jgi:aryl-alcohol dehydrogenase-like predicted oxidoreductase
MDGTGGRWRPDDAAGKDADMTASLGTRTLGRNGLTVSTLGLGCMGMSQSYGPADRDESIATIHRALDLGVTFLDTSDVYGSGHNEELVGEAIADRRDEVQLATKFSLTHGEDGMRIDGRPENVRACAGWAST